MTRPILDAHEKRTENLPPIRVRLSELLYIQEQSKIAGLSVTDYIRTLALTEEVKPRKSKIEGSLLVELNRIGVNLNQITKHVNAGRTDPNILNHAMNDLIQIMDKLDRAL